jgi:hypothetical protein
MLGTTLGRFVAVMCQLSTILTISLEYDTAT